MFVGLTEILRIIAEKRSCLHQKFVYQPIFSETLIFSSAKSDLRFLSNEQGDGKSRLLVAHNSCLVNTNTDAGASTLCAGDIVVEGGLDIIKLFSQIFLFAVAQNSVFCVLNLSC